MRRVSLTLALGLGFLIQVIAMEQSSIRPMIATLSAVVLVTVAAYPMSEDKKP